MNTFGMVYNKRKHCYEPIYVEKSAKERWIITTIIEQQNAKLKKQYKIDHANGYCPHCHMLIPLNGHCDCQNR